MNKHLLGLLLLAPALLLAVGCFQGEKKAGPSEVVVAVVNGKEVYGDFFLSEYQKYKRRLKIADTDNRQLENQLREGVMKRLVDSIILREEAEKAGIKAPSDEVDTESLDIIQGFSPARLQLILEKSGQTLDEWKTGVANNLVIEKLIQLTIVPLINIPEDEIKKRYKENLDKFQIAERVHAFHIVTPSLSEADELRNELLYGADFSELATKHSKSPDAENGGDLGIFAKGLMPREFDDVLFQIKIGEISKVVESPYGYHIFKIVEKFKPRGMSYEEAKEKIYNDVFYEQVEEKFTEWMTQRRQEARVVVFSERLYAL